MPVKSLREGARLYALKKAAKSMASDLPILPAQAALGAGVMAATYGGSGKAAAAGAAFGVAGHLANSGNEARKIYKNAKHSYREAMKRGDTHDFSGERYKPLTKAEQIGKRMGTWKEEFMDEYETIIQGTVEENPSAVQAAVHNILANKIAEKIEQTKYDMAQSMFGDEDGRPKTDDEDLNSDVEEDDDADLEDFDFENDDEDAFGDIEHEDDIDLESDK